MTGQPHHDHTKHDQSKHDQSKHDRSNDVAEGAQDAGKPKLDKRDVIALIWATYRATLPYLLVFLVAFLFVTWLITDVFLR
jgi:hypothetical protein